MMEEVLPAPVEPLSDVFDEAKERKLLMNQNRIRKWTPGTF
jgi:hypothetical protein